MNLLALGAALAALSLGAGLAKAAPVTDHQQVDGLRAPARILIDHWGVAHIYAGSQRDAFFLQGYNAARDRLWQIDLWRKRGLGLLSASFGPDYVAQDRAARLFLYRGDMKAEWASYAPGAQAETEAFVAGINAYVAEVRAGAKPLPVEFKLTGSLPDPWQTDDVVRIRSHALVANVLSEVARAQVACAAGLSADALRKRLEPPHKIKIPEGLDPCVVPADVLSTYVLGTEPVAFAPATMKVAALSPDQMATNAANEGSNNWVVSGARTATGRPLVANDPHRQVGVPSLRYIVQLDAPGLSIIGAGEPALPGISLGHNEDAAFGLTIFGVDQEDLYVYDLNPADPNQYRYRGGWEPIRIVTETIPVKGEAPREIKLKFTRHGPVIDEDPGHGHAFAIRSVWQAPGTAGYMQASWLTHAKTWADLEIAHDHWGTPPENLVWGDKTGAIGWVGAALAPVRPNWDGLMPVPGDGRYEWQGFMKAADLPRVKNPAKGWIATANEMNLPQGYPDEARHVSFEWNDRARIDRIDEVLAANAKVSVADSMALQTDSHNAMSRRLTALLAPLNSEESQMAKALSLLKAWDHNETTDSVATTIYEVWSVKHLGRAVVHAETPAAAWPLIGAGSLDAIILALEHPDAALGPDPAAARDRILLASLKDALGELNQRLGPDMSAWAWGNLHKARFVPAIATLADPALAGRMTLGPQPIPGGAFTPKAAGYDPKTFEVTHGASVRLVMDVGAWDNSMMVNTPGESLDPASPHYGDLFPLWARGDYVPMLFSKKAVEGATERVIDLTPGV
jgi:penicillin amidase